MLSLCRIWAGPLDCQCENRQLLGGLWWTRDCIAVPRANCLCSALIWDCYDSPCAKHNGGNKTLHSMQHTFWRPGMFPDVNEQVQAQRLMSAVSAASVALANLLGFFADSAHTAHDMGQCIY